MKALVLHGLMDWVTASTVSAVFLVPDDFDVYRDMEGKIKSQYRHSLKERFQEVEVAELDITNEGI